MRQFPYQMQSRRLSDSGSLGLPFDMGTSRRLESFYPGLLFYLQSPECLIAGFGDTETVACVNIMLQHSFQYVVVPSGRYDSHHTFLLFPISTADLCPHGAMPCFAGHMKGWLFMISP